MLPEKVREAKADSRDAAGKGSKVVEKIPQPSEKSKSPQVTLKLTTEGINIQEARVAILHLPNEAVIGEVRNSFQTIII